MKRKLPPYCNYEKNRHGTVYVRFRRRGFSCYLKAKPGTPEFDQEYANAISGVRAPIGANRSVPGSLKSLVVHYYASPEYTGLAESTKTTYRNILNRFVAKHGEKKVRHLERRHIKTIIGNMSDRPQAANNLLNILRCALNLGLDIGMIDTNPAHNVRGYSTKTPGFHTWTESEIEQFSARYPRGTRGTRARLALMLLLHTAQRRGDVVCMGRQHIQEGRLRLTQSKTGAFVDIPLHPDLVAELAIAKNDNMTFLLTSFGKPFTAAGFGNWFRDKCNEAGLKHCSAHGLRKAASRRMAESGKTPNQIGSVTGHTTLTEVERYTREADRAGLADDALSASDWTNGEQKLPTLRNGVGKKAKKQ